VLLDRCVSCGVCVMECSADCFRVRDDTDAVRDLLSGARPVILLLATEFIAGLAPLSPEEVESRAEALGFFSVETTLLGEELIARAYEGLCERQNGLPILRSTCPVVVDWIRKYRPALAQVLAPYVPPYVAQARLIREVYDGDVAVVYASPCFARKQEISSSRFGGAVDVAIDFLELASLLHEARAIGSGDCGTNRPAPLKELSLIDGFPRAPLEQRTMTASDVNVSRGLSECDRVLDAVMRGQTAPRLMDLLNCEGCIDGPAVSPGLSVFVKRNIEMAEREARPPSTISTRDILGFLPRVDIGRSFAPDPVEVPTPDDEELDAVLAQGGIVSRDETLDCRACGYATCLEFAAAVFAGTNSWEMCFPLQQRRLREDLAHLSETAAVDQLTGLWNRNALSTRLDDEISRFKRYGSPVSLIMLDLDDFKRVNDERGHLVGDQLLGAIGHLLAQDIRASDFAARFGGDEFAVVLPGTTKTEAYAVAEKIRTAISSLRVSPAGDESHSVGTRASAGVATVGSDVGSGLELIEAADRALYAAKAGGRDQVRIASE
jgi:diguanylate cyclase (GGDEF)-like protein